MHSYVPAWVTNGGLAVHVDRKREHPVMTEVRMICDTDGALVRVTGGFIDRAVADTEFEFDDTYSRNGLLEHGGREHKELLAAVAATELLSRVGSIVSRLSEGSSRVPEIAAAIRKALDEAETANA